jgi:hypothetical protein
MQLFERQRGERRQPREVAREWADQADGGVRLAEVGQDKETLSGEGEHIMFTELGEVHLDALAGGGVEEAMRVATHTCSQIS